MFIATHCLRLIRAAAGPSASRTGRRKRVELGLDRPLSISGLYEGLRILIWENPTKAGSGDTGDFFKAGSHDGTYSPVSCGIFIIALLMGSIAALKNKIIGCHPVLFGGKQYALLAGSSAAVFLFYKAQAAAVGLPASAGVTGPDTVTGFILLDGAIQGLGLVRAVRETFAAAGIEPGYRVLRNHDRMMRTQTFAGTAAGLYRTARSKGLPEHTVIRRHAMKTPFPILTMLGYGPAA